MLDKLGCDKLKILEYNESNKHKYLELKEKNSLDRILFGTDYPFLNQAFSMLSVLRATTDEEERKIFLVITQKKYCIFNL